MRARDAESGQTIVLIAGYVAIALLAVSATLAATSVNLEARRLLSVADGAAAAAADSFSLSQGEGGGIELHLGDSAVRASVSGYVADTGAASRFRGFRIIEAGAAGDGTTAVVRLGATVSPPIVGWFVPEGIPVAVESSARTALTR